MEILYIHTVIARQRAFRPLYVDAANGLAMPIFLSARAARLAAQFEEHCRNARKRGT